MTTFNICKDCEQGFPREEGNGINRPKFEQPTMYDHFANFQKFKAAKELDAYIKRRRAEITTHSKKFTDWQPPNSKEDVDLVSTQDIDCFRQEMKELNNRRSKSCDEALATTHLQRIAGGATANTKSCKVTTNGQTETLNKDDKSAEQFEEIKQNKPIKTDGRLSEKNIKRIMEETVEKDIKPEISVQVGRGFEKPPETRSSLLAISHSPVKCPIGDCNRTIGVTSVLAHFIRDHGEESGVQCQEVFSGRRSVLVFDTNSMQFRHNVCLGLLAYGGINSDHESRPAMAGICTYNAFIEAPNLHLEAHLPIVIMACLTTWGAVLRSKELEEEITNREDSSQHVIVMWLASIPTTKPLHCVLTVYDKMMTTSRSNILRVRNLSDPQNPSEFIRRDNNFLRLSRSEVLLLTKSASQTLNVEIIINDYDK